MGDRTAVSFLVGLEVGDTQRQALMEKIVGFPPDRIYPSRNPKGQVAEYHLPEVEGGMLRDLMALASEGFLLVGHSGPGESYSALRFYASGVGVLHSWPINHEGDYTLDVPFGVLDDAARLQKEVALQARSLFAFYREREFVYAQLAEPIPAEVT